MSGVFEAFWGTSSAQLVVWEPAIIRDLTVNTQLVMCCSSTVISDSTTSGLVTVCGRAFETQSLLLTYAASFEL